MTITPSLRPPIQGEFRPVSNALFIHPGGMKSGPLVSTQTSATDPSKVKAAKGKAMPSRKAYSFEELIAFEESHTPFRRDSQSTREISSVGSEKGLSKSASSQTVGSKKLTIEVNQILQDLSESNFDAVSTNFVNLVTENCGSYETLEEIIVVVHERALESGSIFLNLCQVLSMELSAFEKKSSGESLTFKRALLELCQKEFQRSMDLSVELQSAGKVLSNDLLKRKNRMLNHMKFLAGLYNRDMVSSKIIAHCIDMLLEDPSESQLECLCAIISTCGAKLDADVDLNFSAKGPNTPMKQWMCQLDHLVASKLLSSEISSNLVNVTALYKNSWVSCTKPQTTSTGTVDAIAKAHSNTKTVRERGDRYTIHQLSHVKQSLKTLTKFTPVESVQAESDTVNAFSLDFHVPEEITRKIHGFVNEYVNAKDLNEVCLCIDEIEMDEWMEKVMIVANCIFICQEIADKPREAIIELLNRLAEKKIIDQSQLVYGTVFAIFHLKEGRNIMIDLPIAAKRTKATLVFLRESNAVTSEMLAQIKVLLKENCTDFSAVDEIFE